MTLADWTFFYNTHGGSISQQVDNPSGQSSPCLEVASGTTDVIKWFPTAGTINGRNILGFKTGKMETWYKTTTTNLVHGFYFRLNARPPASTNSGLTGSTNTWVGYALTLEREASGATHRFLLSKRDVGDTVTTTLQALTVGTSSEPATGGAWWKYRVTWIESGAGLTIRVEYDKQDGNGFAKLNGDGFLDASMIAANSDCDIGFYNQHGTDGSLNAVSSTVRLDGTQIYKNV